MENNKFVCSICEKRTSCKSNLNRHMKNVHTFRNQIQDCISSRFVCPVESCENKFQRDAQLREHLKEHGVEIEVQHLEFNTETESTLFTSAPTKVEDYEEWLYSVQNKTVSEYVKDCSTKTLASGYKKDYLYCNRSYKNRCLPNSQRKRNFKSQGSKKTGRSCPSRIEVSRKNGEKILVTYWKTHCGHSSDLGHLRLDKRSRNEIAGKLMSGVKFEKVLDDVRNAEEMVQNKRVKLLERQDLHNIVRDFSITYSTKRHRDDAVSVKLWVEDMKSLGEENPVLYFKPQGESNENLNSEDFMLVLMTDFQVSQIQKFGHDKLCVDGTHGTNPYDILLYTLLAVDEFGSGCPVAYCFSNRGDEEVLKLFFEKIKDKVGVIEVQTFMSDDAPVFFNAWSNVMPVPKHKLLCSWHVDKCWQKNLCKIKGGSGKKSMVYKTLKALLEYNGSLDDFKICLNQTVSDLIADDDTSCFGEYFIKYYASRPECWAYCHRRGLGINTNNHLEAYHKNLKHIYLEGKKIKRLDKTIHAVLNIARDSLFKRLIKLTKNSSDHRTSRIYSSHKKSDDIGPDMIKIVNPGSEWLVKSSSSESYYSVMKMNDICLEPCIMCTSCQICVHSFKCTCIDNVIKMNICKHIHSCSKLFYPALMTSKQISNNVEIEVNRLVEAKTTFNVKHLNSVTNERLVEKANLLANLLHKGKLEGKASHDIGKKLDECIDLANSSSDSSFKLVPKINVNKHVEKQIRFFSTKKKGFSKRVVKKPTTNEKSNIVEHLLNENDTQICYVHTDYDHSYGKN